MIEIHMREVDVNLVINPADGRRTLRFVDERSGIAVRLDFPEESARQLAGALTASAIVAVPAHALPDPTEVKH